MFLELFDCLEPVAQQWWIDRRALMPANIRKSVREHAYVNCALPYCAPDRNDGAAAVEEDIHFTALVHCIHVIANTSKIENDSISGNEVGIGSC